jgi:hypothetical protein
VGRRLQWLEEYDRKLSNHPLSPTARRTGRSGRCWSGFCERPTARVQAEDDVVQVHVARGGGQRDHSSEQRGFTEDRDDAKANVNEHAERLRREGRTDWFGFVLDLDRPTVITPPGSTPPMLGLGARVLRRRARLTATFAELLIDCEEDRTLRAVLVGMLRETDR